MRMLHNWVVVVFKLIQVFIIGILGVDGRTCQAVLLVLIPLYSKTWQGRTEKGTESNVFSLLSDQNVPQKLK